MGSEIVPRATCNVHRATCGATCYVPGAACSCSVPRAWCYVLRAWCYLLRATCSVLGAPCFVPRAPRELLSRCSGAGLPRFPIALGAEEKMPPGGDAGQHGALGTWHAALTPWEIARARRTSRRARLTSRGTVQLAPGLSHRPAAKCPLRVRDMISLSMARFRLMST